MRLLTGFIYPSEGKITINGNNINNYKEAVEIKKNIGYLPENNPLYGEMLVVEYLNMMAEIKQVAKEKIKKEVRKTAEKTGITEVFYRPISDLSKGYKQRVGLAAAIVNNPEILILDEPTEGLDPKQRIDIRNLIKNLGQDKTVIISSHVLSEIENTCDRIIIINKSKIAADGGTKEIIAGTQGKRMINLEIAGKNIEKELRTLVGDKNIKTQEYIDNKLKATIETDTGQEIRPQIFNLAKKNDWIIWEMHQKEVSLEDVFRELTK
jgi:ABC-2 type transport system ATP-binding protein